MNFQCTGGDSGSPVYTVRTVGTRREAKAVGQLGWLHPRLRNASREAVGPLAVPWMRAADTTAHEKYRHGDSNASDEDDRPLD
jgi:SH3-like domain-containing protein